MNDIDKALKKALAPAEYPSEELNDKIISQAKRKEYGKMNFKNKKIIVAAAVAICLLFIPASAYAAYKYLLPKEVAKELEDKKLEQSFDQKGSQVMQTITDGLYKMTYLGHVTGEALNDRTGSNWELNPDRIYVAVAIEKADGIEMSNGDVENLFVSPLIQGLAPWTYNIVTMNGSYIEKVIDGVLYRIIECDNIEVFSDKELYLAVADTKFFSNEAYQYDEATGKITPKKDYAGTNVLFQLSLDPSGADKKKAKQYLEQLEKEWNSDSISDSKENKSSQDKSSNAGAGKKARIQKELFTDEMNGIKIRIKDNDSSSWSAGEESAQTILSYHLAVEGENIEALTYTLNQGEFSNNPEHGMGDAKLYGNKLSLTYGEQKDRDYLYSIYFTGNFKDYGYDAKEVSKLGETNMDARGRIQFEVLDKAVSDTKMLLKIKMKDGGTVEKKLTFHNIPDDRGQNFWIAISVE